MATKDRLNWLETYLETGDAKGAVRTHYPDVNDKYVCSKASILKREMAAQIDERLRERFRQDSPAMANIIKSLATSAASETVKLNAAKDWLSRAGYDAAQVLEVKAEQTEQELLERLQIVIQGLDKDIVEQLGINQILETLSSKELH